MKKIQKWRHPAEKTEIFQISLGKTEIFQISLGKVFINFCPNFSSRILAQGYDVRLLIWWSWVQIPLGAKTFSNFFSSFFSIFLYFHNKIMCLLSCKKVSPWQTNGQQFNLGQKLHYLKRLKLLFLSWMSSKSKTETAL